MGSSEFDRTVIGIRGGESLSIQPIKPGREERPPTPIRGADTEPAHWEDADQWLSIYTKLWNFKKALKDRVRLSASVLGPTAQSAVVSELEIIQGQMDADQLRIDFWRRRAREWDALHLDNQRATLRYQASVATLTRREFQLLRLLLDNPHRSFTSNELVSGAWPDESRTDGSLIDKDARTCLRRLRQVLITLNAPAYIALEPERGYSLFFKGKTPSVVP